MMRKIAIYGAGGLGKEVQTIIKSINDIKPTFDFIGYFDDEKGKDTLGDYQMINSFDQPLELAVAVGNPTLKEKLVEKINNSNVHFPQLIHPSVIFGDEDKISIADGVILGAGTVITLDVTLEKHAFVNLNCTLGHDVYIGSYSSIMPGVNIAGNVRVERESFVGSGANIINNIVIGERCTVGSGAVVVDNVQSGQTVVGIPAKPIKS